MSATKRRAGSSEDAYFFFGSETGVACVESEGTARGRDVLVALVDGVVEFAVVGERAVFLGRLDDLPLGSGVVELDAVAQVLGQLEGFLLVRRADLALLAAGRGEVVW